MTIHFFSIEESRSERSLQAELLVPALARREIRFKLLFELLSRSPAPLSKQELDSATVLHFVWPLRDMFWRDRNAAGQSSRWTELRIGWVQTLNLPEWANDHAWWRHPTGDYQGDPDFVVHPCNRLIGWVPPAIAERSRRASAAVALDEAIRVLIAARKVLNTEADCLIQTDRRLLVIECKGETAFSTEQRVRQEAFRKALHRKLPREHEPVYLELSKEGITAPNGLTLHWDAVRKALQNT